MPQKQLILTTDEKDNEKKQLFVSPLATNLFKEDVNEDSIEGVLELTPTLSGNVVPTKRIELGISS